MSMEKGYFQIYTGNGKGKTTAALGLTVRAVGAGLKVYIGQFIKNMECSEITSLHMRFPEVTVEQYGTKSGCFINRQPSKEDIEAAQQGYKKADAALHSGKYDIVILDEINIALFFKTISLEQALKLANTRPEKVELIFTGRYAPKELIEKADLVTEMKEVKHYFEAGVTARDGIEK